MTNEQLASLAAEALGMDPGGETTIAYSTSFGDWELTGFWGNYFPPTCITIAHRGERAIVVTKSFKAASEFLKEVRPDMSDIPRFCGLMDHFFRVPRHRHFIDNAEGKTPQYAPSFADGVFTFYYQHSLGINRVTIDSDYVFSAPRYVEVFDKIVTGQIVASEQDCLVMDDGGMEVFLPHHEIDVLVPEHPEEYIGRTLQMKLTGFDPASNTLIASRRKLIQEQIEFDEAEAKKQRMNSK